MNNTKKIAVILAIMIMILAFSTAIIKYVRFNEIEMTLIGAGLALPAAVISIAVMTSPGKK